MSDFVYLVMIGSADDNQIVTIHKLYENALATWHAVRIGMIWKHEAILELKDNSSYEVQHCEEEIKRLLCEDPEKIDFEWMPTPYIFKMGLKE